MGLSPRGRRFRVLVLVRLERGGAQLEEPRVGRRYATRWPWVNVRVRVRVVAGQSVGERKRGDLGTGAGMTVGISGHPVRPSRAFPVERATARRDRQLSAGRGPLEIRGSPWNLRSNLSGEAVRRRWWSPRGMSRAMDSGVGRDPLRPHVQRARRRCPLCRLINHGEGLGADCQCDRNGEPWRDDARGRFSGRCGRRRVGLSVVAVEHLVDSDVDDGARGALHGGVCSPRCRARTRP